MCTSLACRKRDTDKSCSFTNGVGAIEGTTCGVGKVNSILVNYLFYQNIENKK